MIAVTMLHWIVFFLLMLLALSIDLWRFYKVPHAIQPREAILMSVGWIALALVFNVWIYIRFGFQPSLDFFTGYFLEKSLSVDNLFIFVILFSYFKVPEQSKHQVLFYGVLGAIGMRALLIWGGISLIEKFEWMFIIFGIFLIITGAGLFIKKEKELIIKENKFHLFIQKFIPITSTYYGNAFLIRDGKKWYGTPLLGLLIMIELTDFIFALDSVPAILGITTDPYLVFTSNILAVFGLRALFFVLEPIMQLFYLLHYALAFILIFIGCKMIFGHWYPISTWITLLLLTLSFSIAIIGSLIWPNTICKK